MYMVWENTCEVNINEICLLSINLVCIKNSRRLTLSGMHEIVTIFALGGVQLLLTTAYQSPSISSMAASSAAKLSSPCNGFGWCDVSFLMRSCVVCVVS